MSEAKEIPNKEIPEDSPPNGTTTDSSLRKTENEAPQPSKKFSKTPEVEHEVNKQPQTGIKPDAIAADGIISFLNAPSQGGHRRTLSAASKAQIDAQVHQLRFQALREQLNGHLNSTIGMLETLTNLNEEAALSVMPADLSVLNVDIRLGAGGSVIGGSNVPPPSMVNSRLQQVVQHARRLQNRLADTASRVLVTGDLNAGKSSLCNALLRRPVLPVDQQPCTDVFCEVVDSEKNHDIEEVHAVRHSTDHYDRDDRRSYDAFSLTELERLVHNSDEFKLLVVYIRDPRPASQSLLSNGVVDICLIDAPGLNVSDVTTTQLFGRQEEIDLVIFVVSANNHFTQSAKEFVSDTAREKSLLFIAVNSFDQISDKERCRKRVLDQVQQLAPETHKGAADFVHFVSSKDPSPVGSPSPDSPDSPEDGNGPSGRNPNGNIDALESSLRNFILDKRSESKLRPARTYLQNVLNDLLKLAAANQKQARSEIEEFTSKLNELAPEIDSSVLEFAQVTDKIDRDTEKLCHSLFSETEKYLAAKVTSIGEAPVVEWEGLVNVFDYAAKTRRVLVDQILTAVEECESMARTQTASAVDSIKKVGVIHVGDQPAFTKVFKSSAMFSRRRDNLSKMIAADFGITDILDIGGLLERPLPVLASSKRALVSTATSNASLGSAVGGAVTALSVYQGAFSTAANSSALSLVGRVSNLLQSRKLVVPAAVLAIAALGAWIIYELPRTIPRKLARKIAFEIDEMGYVPSNAERIAAECRKVLKYPAQDVRSAFQTRLESRTRQRDEFDRCLHTAERSLQVFEKLVQQADAVRADVSQIQV